jgi:predicted  nucleic acid-binding Zn-ribbon protein
VQYKLAQQASEERQSQLQQEVSALQKLYSQAQVATVAAAANTNTEALTLKSELDSMKQAFAVLEETVAQLRKANKKLEKEKWTLHARIEETVKAAPSAEALATLRRALDAERECERVKMQLESMKRTAKQHQLEDEVHMKKVEAQLEEANRTISTWTVCSIDHFHVRHSLVQGLLCA